MREGRYTIRNCNKTTYMECTPETKPFSLLLIVVCNYKYRRFEGLEEQASSQSQVKAVRLQDKLGKQNFHEDMKKVFEPGTTSLENTSQDITNSITETSIKNNQALEKLNNKLLKIMNDRGILTSYLMSVLSKITNPENATQFKLVNDGNSKRVNDLKINKSILNTLYDNMVTFRDTSRE